jgi:hypothetical protein
MARTPVLTALLTTLLLIFATLATAKPARLIEDFDFKPGTNRLDCPAAGGTKFVGPQGGVWGILCGVSKPIGKTLPMSETFANPLVRHF